MKLRILFTLAILAGLAAAPGAQTFRWKAGRSQDVKIRADQLGRRIAIRVERAVDRVARQVERQGALAGSNTDGCEDTLDRDDDREQHCEVREETMPGGALTVDASPNGAVVVEAWNQNTIRVRAIVRANARTAERARELVAGVQVQAGGGRVSAAGPDTSRREWWSVSYRVSVPRETDLDLDTYNGGISISGVTGRVTFDTDNGGVKLADLGGDVRGRTRNGGVAVTLAGARWDGAGLDVETTNGGVTVSIPDGYNAELEARTHNGGFRSDYPITLTGELNTRRGISATLGSGGAPVRVRTTNGGLRIARR